MMDEGAPWCYRCKAYHVFPHDTEETQMAKPKTVAVVAAAPGTAAAVARAMEVAKALPGTFISLLDAKPISTTSQNPQVQPEFTVTKLVLKHEDEDEETGAAHGPLFYEGANGETAPVFLDLKSERPGSKYGYFPVWFSYTEAKKIAAELNLPLESF